MDAEITTWGDARFDQPVPGIERRCVDADNMLVANIVLQPGSIVPVHSHPSEQVSIILWGKIKWILGDERREEIVQGGAVVRLPANCPHGVETIEETHLIDILSPHGLMGVDKIKAGDEA